MSERDYHATWIVPWLHLRRELVPLVVRSAARLQRDQRQALSICYDLLAEFGDPPPLPGTRLRLEFTRRKTAGTVQPRFFHIAYAPAAYGSTFSLKYPHCLTDFFARQYRIQLGVNDCRAHATLDRAGRLICDADQVGQLVAATIRAFPGLASRQMQLRAELDGYLGSRLVQFATTICRLVLIHADPWPASHIAPLIRHAYKLRHHTIDLPDHPPGASQSKKRRWVDGF